MRVKPWIATVAVLFWVLMATRSLHAAAINETFTFDLAPFTGQTIDTATNPSTITAMAPPASPWTGSFSLIFDPTLSFQGSLQAFTSNIALLNAAQWGYVTYVSNGFEYLDIGNDCNLATRSCIDQDGTGFLPNAALIILNLGPQASPTVSSPAFDAAEYTTQATGGAPVPGFTASAGSFTATPVPEPAALAAFGSALLVLGAIRTLASAPQPRRNTSARPQRPHA